MVLVLCKAGSVEVDICMVSVWVMACHRDRFFVLGSGMDSVVVGTWLVFCGCVSSWFTRWCWLDF